MNRFGGTFFFGDVTFFLSASSLRSLCGLFCGCSCCGSIATARIRKFREVGLVSFRVLGQIWRGNGEIEEEKEMLSENREEQFGFNWVVKEEERSIFRV